MGKSSSIGSLFLNLVLMLSVLVIIFAMTDAKFLGRAGFLRPRSVSCATVLGVESGDTCAGVAQKFNLSPQYFSMVNPNLVCDALFVGQWLCIDGTLT